MHSHWSPQGLVRQRAAGQDWYGWRVDKDEQGRERIFMGDRSLPFSVTNSLLTDPGARAADRRQREGIDMQCPIPTGIFWNYHLDEAQARRFTLEVNEEIAAVQRAFPQAYRGLAVLPMQHPALALEMMEDAAGRLGLRSIIIASNVNNKNLDEPDVLSVLEAAARMKLSIVVHPVYWGNDWGNPGEERFSRYHFGNSFGAPLESSLAAMSVIYSGLLDRHPDLRIMFTQGGGWIHFGVGRFNLRYQQRPDASPMAHAPVDYLSRLYFDCLVHDDEALALLFKRCGAQRLMIGTDHPGSGNILGGAVPWIANNPLFSADDKEHILWRNAARFLGLAASELTPHQETP